MYIPPLVPVVVATATWAGFASIMKSYFRFSTERTTAKTWLIVTASLCTVLQIVTIAFVKPESAVWFWLGVAGYIVANGLFWWALSAHGKTHPAFAFIRVPPASLTTAGPYRLMRHPIYSAYLLAWCAGAAMVAQLWLLMPVVGMAVFYLCAARQEEQSFLTSHWATSYQEYRRHTGMFVPRISGLFSKS